MNQTALKNRKKDPPINMVEWELPFTIILSLSILAVPACATDGTSGGKTDLLCDKDDTCAQGLFCVNQSCIDPAEVAEEAAESDARHGNFAPSVGKHYLAIPQEHCSSENYCGPGGTVQIFLRDRHDGGPDTWERLDQITAIRGDDGDQFGYSVSISGEYIAIGAPGDDSCYTGSYTNTTLDANPAEQLDNGCAEAGAVHIYQRANGSAGPDFQPVSYVKASNTEPGDAFGSSVALLISETPSVDNLVVGAPDEDGCSVDINGDEASNACSNAGAVYAFHRYPDSHTLWHQITYIKDNPTSSEDMFGVNVELETEALLNVTSCDGALECSGAISAFSYNEGGWIPATN